jgi:hypothetical protein
MSKQPYWKLVHSRSNQAWLFDKLAVLKECVEYTYPGCNIDYYPIDKDVYHPNDMDMNVFIDGEIAFRVLEIENGLIASKQVLEV